jgi:hypothetical protein
VNIVGYFTDKKKNSEMTETDLELYEQEDLTYAKNPD